MAIFTCPRTAVDHPGSAHRRARTRTRPPPCQPGHHHHHQRVIKWHPCGVWTGGQLRCTTSGDPEGKVVGAGLALTRRLPLPLRGTIYRSTSVQRNHILVLGGWGWEPGSFGFGGRRGEPIPRKELAGAWERAYLGSSMRSFFSYAPLTSSSSSFAPCSSVPSRPPAPFCQNGPFAKIHFPLDPS